MRNGILGSKGYLFDYTRVEVLPMNEEISANNKKILTGLWNKASEDTKQPFINLFSDEHIA